MGLRQYNVCWACRGIRKNSMKIPYLRWWIITFIFLAAVLNYVDRLTLTALAKSIQVDLSMDDRDYANITNIFLIAYTIAYLISGKIVDKLGTRRGTILFVIWWSIANMLTACVQGVRSMGACRFLLGLGEAGIWPAASKAVSEWFPAKERALAIGLYTMGATIGATMAPLIVIPLAEYDYSSWFFATWSWLSHGTGWRVAFLFTGALGFVWLIPWLLLYRKPQESRFLSKEELSYIESDADGGEAQAVEPSWTWRQVLCFRPTWLLMIARMITDPVWYFYQFWFAKYLASSHQLEQKDLTIIWVIYAAAGVGSIAGGWWSGKLIAKGRRPVQGRMAVMVACACLMPISALICHVGGVNGTLALSVITVVAALAWLINISSLVVDVVPKHSIGTVFSVVAAGSTIGGIIMNTLVSRMVMSAAEIANPKPAGILDQAVNTLAGPIIHFFEGKGYTTWFLIMAFLHPVALLLLHFGRIYRFNQTPHATT